MSNMRVFVTGGNAGIGFALCKQLVLENSCHVFLGSRNEARGQEAVSSIQAMMPADCKGSVELIVIDVGDDFSVVTAAELVKVTLSGAALDAVVNNAGVGPKSDDATSIMNVNFYGVKRVIDAFGPLLKPDGRVVNVGSGAGPMYVNKCPLEAQKLLCNVPESWEQIVSWIPVSSDGKSGVSSEADTMSGYGPSKAFLASYTMLLAKEHPMWQIGCCSPGFIDTKLTAGWGASKTPDEGTVAIKQLLFEPLKGNGWYYGSDGVRSPYHFMRNPGEPEYDGVSP